MSRKRYKNDEVSYEKDASYKPTHAVDVVEDNAVTPQPTTNVASDADDVVPIPLEVARVEEAFIALDTAFNNGTASIANQKVLYNSIKQALVKHPHDTTKLLGRLPEKNKSVVDATSLRFDHMWNDHTVKVAFNALIAMLSIKASIIKPYYMDEVNLKAALSSFGDNSYYLATLYTEV